MSKMTKKDKEHFQLLCLEKAIVELGVAITLTTCHTVAINQLTLDALTIIAEWDIKLTQK